MENVKLIEELFNLKDSNYKKFQSSLIPTINPENVIGIRTPALKDLAKKICRNPEVYKKEEFLSQLPHKYFDEDQLHAFIISLEKDFNLCIKMMEDFLPFINNWATCDQLCPLSFKKKKKNLLPCIDSWLKSGKTYTVRFGIKVLMQHFLDLDFKIQYAEAVAEISSDEYYVNMMRAWYFATALAKQWDSIIPFIEKNQLDDWTHNKTIQKSIESYRIIEERKSYLRKLKK
ncbi:MAG: DNA alkylation repair protein [Treponema sp.]|nr:DNA alkylation repair protein [Treponema sp.]